MQGIQRSQRCLTGAKPMQGLLKMGMLQWAPPKSTRRHVLAKRIVQPAGLRLCQLSRTHPAGNGTGKFKLSKLTDQHRTLLLTQQCLHCRTRVLKSVVRQDSASIEIQHSKALVVAQLPDHISRATHHGRQLSTQRGAILKRDGCCTGRDESRSGLAVPHNQDLLTGRDRVQ